MTVKEVFETLKKTGLPVAFGAFSEEDLPNPPYIIFTTDGKESLFADDERYKTKTNIIVMLYTPKKDFLLEEKVEDVLSESGILFESDEDYLSDLHLQETSYLFQI